MNTITRQGVQLLRWEGTAPGKGTAYAFEVNEYNAQRTIAMKLRVEQWLVRVWIARGECLASLNVA